MQVDSFFLLQIVLLNGPPGLGKTTLAHVIAKHSGYNVVEMNARYKEKISLLFYCCSIYLSHNLKHKNYLLMKYDNCKAYEFLSRANLEQSKMFCSLSCGKNKKGENSSALYTVNYIDKFKMMTIQHK